MSGRDARRQISGKRNLLMTPSQLVRNKEQRCNFTFCVNSNGEKYYKRNGEVFSVAEIENAYPIPESLLYRQNVDGRNSWATIDARGTGKLMLK